MEELLDLKQRLEGQRPASWQELPDIALYMDQIISYMPRQLIHYGEGESLTSAMVNNYIKDGAMPRAEGKRYSRTHLAYLTALCALKQVLSVKDAGLLLAAASEGRPPQKLYEQFREELDRALDVTAGSLDGIACNPPYTAPGAGIPSEDGARRAARQGDSLSLEDVARGARYALRFGGRLCLCLRPQRLAEAVEVFHSHQLEPKRLRLVQQRAGKAPFLFLLECRRGGKPGMEVGPVLLLEREDGSPTQEIEAIYGDYRDNPEHRKQ